MIEALSSLTCFIVAICSFLMVKPYSERLAVRILSEYRMRTRIRKVSGQERNDEDNEFNEDIGLSSKGPLFDSNILNFIANQNQSLIDEMHELLLQAGKRHDAALEEFMKTKVTSCIALFFILFLVLTTNDFGLPFYLSLFLSFIFGIYGGHKLTNLNIKMLANKRKDAIEHGVPDLVDLLVICAESGLDLNRSIQRIAREMRTSNPTLADELTLTSIELEMIPDHRVAFENLENRTNSLQIKTISKTLSQSIEYGSSLAVSLRDLAVESRQKRMLEAEGKAAQAPTLLTLPMMFFILPCLFIVMLGPVIIGVINSFSTIA